MRRPTPRWSPGVGAVDVNLSDKDSLPRAFRSWNRYGSDRHRFPIPIFFQTFPATTTWLRSPSSTPSRPGCQRIPAGFQPLLPELPGGRLESGRGWINSQPVRGLRIEHQQPGPGTAMRRRPGISETQYQATENLSWTKGTHSLKFGFDGWKQISPQDFTQRGAWRLRMGLPVGLSVRLLPGLHRTALAGRQRITATASSPVSNGNDSWKATQHLTVNVGPALRISDVPYSERLQDG